MKKLLVALSIVILVLSVSCQENIVDNEVKIQDEINTSSSEFVNRIKNATSPSEFVDLLKNVAYARHDIMIISVTEEKTVSYNNNGKEYASIEEVESDETLSQKEKESLRRALELINKENDDEYAPNNQFKNADSAKKKITTIETGNGGTFHQYIDIEEVKSNEIMTFNVTKEKTLSCNNGKEYASIEEVELDETLSQEEKEILIEMLELLDKENDDE